MDVSLASDQDNFKSATESSEEEDTVDANERLLTASRNGQVEVVRDLISRSKLGEISLDVNCKGNQKFNRGWTSLHLAAYFGHKNVVKILLENGAGIDVTNPNGDTALHKAAYTGRLDVVRVLLDSGADVTLINSEGQTPRLFAKTREISELILAAEDHDNKKREQIFLSSVREGKLDLIQDMLQKQEKRPNLGCRDAYGNSALHIAAQANQKEIAVLLIQSGLAADLKNEKDKTPIDFARNNEMKQILGVRPIKEFSLHPHRCEGVLFKKSRFLGFRPVFVVLERGVLSYFRSRGDASTGTRRKGMRYLDGTIILLPKKSENNNCEFILKYSDGIQHTFSTGEGEQEIARQKWLNALKDHINYSSHYTHQGVTQSDEEEEILSLGSLQDTLKTAQAQQKLLEKEMMELTSAVTNPGGSTVALQQIQKISQMAGEMNITFSQCLTLFQQQEEVRALQLKEEMEKSRVLQEALHALATEHHELEQSIAVRKPSTQRYYDTDEDEFYDCDE
ncbi:oxysterol-binding protein-related protein 1-like, partial [Saccostrea cucullata]|uniref:oxysterol-binding protein-related protein 1-like n=1 Tax=Saccostrea cuccullata TaxID=36930 RepID=UPI002ED526FB